MPEIIGLLPMGGQGSRLGFSFPKPLAPTVVTDECLVPLYAHALCELWAVTTTIYAITNTGTDACLRRDLQRSRVEALEIEAPQLPGALGEAGRRLTTRWGADTLIAVALPDSIWRHERERSMKDVVAAVRRDGALALFTAGADQLDTVTVADDRVLEVTTKTTGDESLVLGWGAFVIRAGSLARMHDDAKDGPQLGRMDMGWAYIGQYVDLGTPDRYVRWHDTRGWLDGSG